MGHDFDLITLGAGSGGVAASRRAASHGAKVAVIEAGRVGGTCVLRGCVPKKLLMYAAQYGDAIAEAAGYGWQLPVDVKAIGCDMLAVTGRKYLRGPRGTGFLYVRKEVQDKLKLFFMDGFTAPVVSREGFKVRTDARRFELYEKSRALTLGLGNPDRSIGVFWSPIPY